MSEQSEPWPLCEYRQKQVLMNAHDKLRCKYKGLELWVFIRDLTGHGSGYSSKICKANGWDAFQDGSVELK